MKKIFVLFTVCAIAFLLITFPAKAEIIRNSRITNTHNAVINNHFCNARHERSKSLTYCRRKYREKSFMFQKKPNKVFF